MLMNHSGPQVSLLVEAARLYYEENMSQQEIAARLSVSRPKVSRLLQRAREEGIVRIDIVDPRGKTSGLEERLCRRFSLEQAVITDTVPDNDRLRRRLGKIGAEYLRTVVTDDMVLGVAWGTTLQVLVQNIAPDSCKGVRVVQLVGGFIHGGYNTFASDITRKTAEALDAESYLLPVPAIVDSAAVRKAVMSDRHIAENLKLGQEADAALFSIGGFSEESTLFRTNYFSNAELKELKDTGAVGDVCTHVLRADGTVCSKELEKRTIGIRLSDLRSIPQTIAVAGGRTKAAAILAALRAGLISVLITDELTAKTILEQSE